MTRELTEDEIDWLEDTPIGRSHTVGGNENLAACEDCDWSCSADTVDYLMDQIGVHLKNTFKPLSLIEMVSRKHNFRAEFGWDPWKSGVLEETTDEAGFLVDRLVMVEMVDDESGETQEVVMTKELEDSYLDDDE